MSTNVQQELTIAVLMLCVITPKERSTASANKGIRETDTIAQVVFCLAPLPFFSSKTEVMCMPGFEDRGCNLFGIQPHFRYERMYNTVC